LPTYNERFIDAETFVLGVGGEVDHYDVDGFRARINAPIDEGRLLVVIDLSEVFCIDATAVGHLICAHRRLRRLEGRLVLVAPTGGKMHRSFGLAGMHGVFICFNTLDEALAPTAPLAA
jgi:anti-sigma B factor antagonist